MKKNWLTITVTAASVLLVFAEAMQAAITFTQNGSFNANSGGNNAQLTGPSAIMNPLSAVTMTSNVTINASSAWDRSVNTESRARIINGVNASPSTPAYMQWNKPAGFTVGTLFAAPYDWSGYGGTESFTISADSTILLGPASQSHTGSYPLYRSAAYGNPLSATTLEADFTSMYSYSGTYYAEIQEIWALPIALLPLSASITASSTSWGNTSQLSNNNLKVDGWNSSTAGAALTATFSGTKGVKAIFLSGITANSGTGYTVEYENGGGWVNVGTVSWSDEQADFLVFDTPLVASSFKLTALGTPSGMGELQFFYEIPEPASLLLLALGGLALQRRRNR